MFLPVYILYRYSSLFFSYGKIVAMIVIVTDNCIIRYIVWSHEICRTVVNKSKMCVKHVSKKSYHQATQVVHPHSGYAFQVLCHDGETLL